MNNTRIAGPHQAQHVGALSEFARTVSYSHRIRALARDAAHETKNVVSKGHTVGSPPCEPELGSEERPRWRSVPLPEY